MSTKKDDKGLTLEAAYSVETPAQNEALYASWAKTYDQSFAAASDYIYPQQVARVFHEQGGHGPVLDAGAGTGLVAEAIAARRPVPARTEFARSKRSNPNRLEKTRDQTRFLKADIPAALAKTNPSQLLPGTDALRKRHRRLCQMQNTPDWSQSWHSLPPPRRVRVIAGDFRSLS